MASILAFCTIHSWAIHASQSWYSFLKKMNSMKRYKLINRTLTFLRWFQGRLYETQCPSLHHSHPRLNIAHSAPPTNTLTLWYMHQPLNWWQQNTSSLYPNLQHHAPFSSNLKESTSFYICCQRRILRFHGCCHITPHVGKSTWIWPQFETLHQGIWGQGILAECCTVFACFRRGKSWKEQSRPRGSRLAGDWVHISCLEQLWTFYVSLGDAGVMEQTHLLIPAKRNFEKNSVFLKMQESHHQVGLFPFFHHVMLINVLILPRRILAMSWSCLHVFVSKFVGWHSSWFSWTCKLASPDMEHISDHYLAPTWTLKTLETLDQLSISGNPFAKVFLMDQPDLPARFDTVLQYSRLFIGWRFMPIHLFVTRIDLSATK